MRSTSTISSQGRLAGKAEYSLCLGREGFIRVLRGAERTSGAGAFRRRALSSSGRECYIRKKGSPLFLSLPPCLFRPELLFSFMENFFSGFGQCPAHTLQCLSRPALDLRLFLRGLLLIEQPQAVEQRGQNRQQDQFNEPAQHLIAADQVTFFQVAAVNNLGD